MKRFLSLLFFAFLLIPLWTYSAQTTQWKSGVSLPRALYAHSTVSGDGRIFVMGGFSLSERRSFADVYAFQPLAGRWTKMPSMRTARGFAGAVYAGGKIIVIGGNDMRRTLNTVEIYDTRTGDWRFGSPMPTARRGFAIAETGGKIYCFGGFQMESRSTLKNVEVYNIARNTWTRLPALPFARQGAAAVAKGDKIYVIGGVIGRSDSPGGLVFLRDMNIYNVKDNSWERGSSMVFDRYYLSVVLVNDKIYAIGGIKGLRPVDVVEVISPESSSGWYNNPSMNLSTPRNALSATVLDGVIYSVGGLDNNGDLQTVETLRVE